MRHRGKIVKWDEAKGFGFIAPDDQTDDVFLHRKAIVAGARRPGIGAAVQYDLTYDAQRRRRARNADVAGAVRGINTLTALAVPAATIGGAWVAARRALIPEWIASLYALSSAIAAIAYALDKHRAQNARWRISEATLHFLEMVGGWPGAFGAQRLLRHKTRKLSFQVIYWLIVLAHVAFWSWFAATKLGWLHP